jgi:signal transduction histidine kinase
MSSQSDVVARYQTIASPQTALFFAIFALAHGLMRVGYHHGNRMSLKRKFLVRNLALVAGLLFVGAASVWGLYGLRQHVQTASYLYHELETVSDAELHLAAASGQVAAEKPDLNVILENLRDAMAQLEHFSSGSHADPNAAPDGYSDKRLAAAHVLGTLRGVANNLAGNADRARFADISSDLLRAFSDVHNLVHECDQLMDAAQRYADERVRASIILMVSLSLAMVVAAVALSIAQHRAVMLPLQTLRDSAQKLAARDFSKRCPTGGDREFSELATDFNLMADELQDFYKNLEAKVAVKSKELVRSERLASVGFLAAGVAHEINNPLNIISGYAELSLKRLAESTGPGAIAEAEQALSVIRDEAFRCKEITAKLLSLARSGDGHREDFSLTHVAEDVTGMLVALKNYRDRRVEVRLDKADPLVVHGSPNEIKQVILNLAVNALEAVKPGVGTISIDGLREGSWVELRVSDNGRGMSADILDRVFEPFFTDKRGGGTGMGLGLSITHAIVEGHGGQIRAESEGVGRGSRFVVRLPAAGVAG